MNEGSHECTCSSVPNLFPVLPNLGPVLQLRPIWDNVSEGKSAGLVPFLPRGERRVLEAYRGGAGQDRAGRAGARGRRGWEGQEEAKQKTDMAVRGGREEGQRRGRKVGRVEGMAGKEEDGERVLRSKIIQQKRQ
ncbi:hypothetical protein E2C01_006819 [Portunus trituberculatus]|uniref:Uncharacterized protein n=1 Tax=Portunus trituberculatus TaxID=210409 RepID=A0A5B7D0P7_PORTR|nr:hypothetical protein [Portunus trituberculatus]